jgi:hypothetical protein
MEENYKKAKGKEGVYSVKIVGFEGNLQGSLDWWLGKHRSPMIPQSRPSQLWICSAALQHGLALPLPSPFFFFFLLGDFWKKLLQQGMVAPPSP